MNFNCTIAVYEDFEKLGIGVRRLHTAAFPDEQVSLVTHDVEAEVPDPAPIEAQKQKNIILVSPGQGTPTLGHSATGTQAESAASKSGNGLGSTLNRLAGEFCAQLGERFQGSEEIARSISDYQSLVGAGCLLLVVTGTVDDAERAAKTLATTDAQQVNVHYAP